VPVKLYYVAFSLYPEEVIRSTLW